MLGHFGYTQLGHINVNNKRISLMEMASTIDDRPHISDSARKIDEGDLA